MLNCVVCKSEGNNFVNNITKVLVLFYLFLSIKYWHLAQYHLMDQHLMTAFPSAQGLPQEENSQLMYKRKYHMHQISFWVF